MKIVGCDLHTRYQQIAMLNAETGELVEGAAPDISNPLRHATSLSLAYSSHFAIVPSWPAHPVFAE
jgi:hypothetical protein